MHRVVARDGGDADGKSMVVGENDGNARQPCCQPHNMGIRVDDQHLQSNAAIFAPALWPPFLA